MVMGTVGRPGVENNLRKKKFKNRRRLGERKATAAYHNQDLGTVTLDYCNSNFFGLVSTVKKYIFT